jgi:hypothetical protein
MPRAVLRGAPNLWQKMRGSTPLHQVATVWKLIAYGEILDAGPSRKDGVGIGQIPNASGPDDGAA